MRKKPLGGNGFEVQQLWNRCGDDESSGGGKSGLYGEMKATGNCELQNEWRRLIATVDMDALQRKLGQLDNEPLLLEPRRLRERLDALDLLDAYFPDTAEPESGGGSSALGLYAHARTIRDRLEAVNCELYDAIRREIQRGGGAETLLDWAHAAGKIEAGVGPANGMGYDYLDELTSGVFQFEAPTGFEMHEAGPIEREPELVFYQLTPARHIFRLIGLTELTASDVLIDLGSGLGHVPMLVSICTRARSIGIELQANYVERARECAQKLNLNKVSFIQEDAREADLSAGTVFYLYTPFTGSAMRCVLERLRREAASRQIRICTYGPCTFVVAEERWLEADSTPETDRIAVFRSRV